VRAFIEPLTIPPIKRPVTMLSGPAPTILPNAQGGEGRTRAHQAPSLYPQKFPFPAPRLYEIFQKAAQVSVSPDLPIQTLWTFDGVSPGPTYYARYGEPMLVRNFNDLPFVGQNGGFGLPSVSTHLHNGHTPSESDGFPCDYFERGQFYDQYYPNAYAGFSSTHTPGGDVNEALSTLWYHDHRIDFTSQNIYKGLAGFFLLFNDSDTGNERTGFRLPGVPDPSDPYAPIQFDVPLMLADRVFDEDTGELLFDLFNLDGILGDTFLVNGKVQPFFEVEPRRYRFRVLNTGPSRFYNLFLTDKGANTSIPFFVVANDGNLLPQPVLVRDISLGVAERMDVVVDFTSQAGKTLYFENRLEQKDGRGPTGDTLPAGAGDFVMQFRVRGQRTVEDASANPSTQRFYSLPDRTLAPRVTRSFRFDRRNGQWAVNNILMGSDCSDVRFRVKQGPPEIWQIQNNSGGWMHPIHVHFEEFQILTRNGVAPPSVERSRKDVMRLGHNESIRAFLRFRDFTGRYPMHCHNVVHEDHAMMLRFDVDETGDTRTKP
jgi:FtsP/CotA-like multicopper oxidase with cupredoxin domain